MQLPAQQLSAYYPQLRRFSSSFSSQLRAATPHRSNHSMVHVSCLAHGKGWVPKGRKMFSFGVVSDIQYADIPDGKSFHGIPRFYRNTLVSLGRAVETFKRENVEFCMHLGDIVDGFQPKDRSDQGLTDVLERLQPLDCKVHHMLGNHCLYNLPRAVLNQRLGIPEQPDGSSYYSFSPHPEARFIILDSYDVSMLGWPEGHPLHEQAVEILRTRNPNENKNMPSGLEGEERRFVMFGGGVSQQQLRWLREQLQEAQEEGQVVVVATHLPLYPGTCPPVCLLWNYEEVLQVLHSFPRGLVLATMAGHTHQNGHMVDNHGIHHLVLPSLVETPPGRDAHGWVEVYADGMLLRGVDCMMSAALPREEVLVERMMMP